MKSTSILLLPAFAMAACSPASDEGETAVAEPTEAEAAAASTQSTASAEPTAAEDIRRFLLQNYPDAAPGQYALAWHDLNGDGANEAIVHLVSSYFCGSGGCNTLVLTPAGPMWSEVANISVSRTPIGVAASSTNGWQDLTVSIGGGGGQSGVALLKFDGEAYPSNPTVPPATAADDAGSVLIEEDAEMITLEAEAAPAE